MPTLARTRATSCLLVSRFSPSSTIWPSARCSGYSSNMWLNVRSKVDLPQPDGQWKAVTLFSGMSRLMPFGGVELPIIEIQITNRDLGVGRSGCLDGGGHECSLFISGGSRRAPGC